MIKKLRKKFILINMSFAILVLLVVFFVLYYSNYQKYHQDSEMALHKALQMKQGDLRPQMMAPPYAKPQDELPLKEKQLKEGSFIPVFVVALDHEGQVTYIDDSGVDVADELAAKVSKEALDFGKPQGILHEYSLRFMLDTQEETRIAFVDVSLEQERMQTFLVRCVLIFAGGILAFFLISLFLSKWALNPVEKAWKQQKQFVADASHELKTPLTVILANLGIIAAHQEQTIKTQSKWFENTKAEAQRMKELLDNLLFLARSDAAAAPQMFLVFDISNTLLSCILPFESLVYEQEVTLIDDIENAVKIKGDEGQIKQLMAILLDNACKYVKPKGVITVRLERKLDKISISVNNTGVVIAKEEVEHLFERFYRSDKARVRKQGGYGLGLSIAKTIAENHHGKIKVVSDVNLGTTFTVMLPIG